MTTGPMAPAGRLLQRDDWSVSMDLTRLRPPAPEADVAGIVAEIRSGGDAALRELTQRFEGADLASVWVSLDEFADAERRVDPELRAALAASAAAVTRFHAEQRNALRHERHVRTAPGVTAWRRWVSIERAGGYVPGGLAAYASSVIMLGVPARLAGVDQLVLATPPDCDGRIAASLLVAARLVGVDRVLKAGGAQAIAALAYGTESVPRVDKIFGAGNAWVTAAKRAVSADVAIDLPAGPSECVVLADADADPQFVALDLLAQAEHGADSVAILVTDTPALADAVEAALPVLAASLTTGERALATLRNWGRILMVSDLEAGLAAVDAVAAEHVSLQCRGADALAARVRTAGAIFIGPWSAVAAGDYATGTNHILPTGGAARAYGGVGVESFGRWIEMQRVTAAGVRRLAPTVATIAAAEGLAAHAASVRIRAERGAAAAADDPVELLRRVEPVAAYPAEASDEEIARRAGLSVGKIVRADMNTLGGGALPAVKRALKGLDPRDVVEYGDLAYVRLRAALGAVAGVDPGRIIPGAGADDLIRLVTTMTVGAGDAVVVPVPTFAMFAVEARLAGARVSEVQRDDLARRQPAAAIRAVAEDESARLVWLCMPNNPTGDAYSLDEIRELATDLPAVVVVDEVYLEFAAASGSSAESAVSLQEELPNVLVLRSLSKAYGLAGARVGYLVVAEALAEQLAASRLPEPIATTSETLALAALADEEEARRRRIEIVAQRERLAAALAALGSELLPSVTNFVAFRPPIAAADVDAALLARGFVVRHYTSGPMAGWLRATARGAAENDRLIAALQEVLS